jgi:hypothetical protein
MCPVSFRFQSEIPHSSRDHENTISEAQRKIEYSPPQSINPNNRWSTPSHKLRSKEKAYEFLPCSTTNSKEQGRERPTLGEGRTKMGAMTKRGIFEMGATPKTGANSKRGNRPKQGATTTKKGDEV